MQILKTVRSVGRIATLAGLVSGAGIAVADYQDEWGPKVDSDLPTLSARNTAGEDLQLSDFTGEKGVLIFIVRSTSW